MKIKRWTNSYIKKKSNARQQSGYKKPEDLIGENGLLKQLTKALIERALQTEITGPLGHDKYAPVLNETRNARNDKSSKTLKGKFGEFPIEIPRPCRPLSHFTCHFSGLVNWRRTLRFRDTTHPQAPNPLDWL